MEWGSQIRNSFISIPESLCLERPMNFSYHCTELPKLNSKVLYMASLTLRWPNTAKANYANSIICSHDVTTRLVT